MKYSISLTKKKTKVKFLMSTRLETKCCWKHPEFSRNYKHLVLDHFQNQMCIRMEQYEFKKKLYLRGWTSAKSLQLKNGLSMILGAYDIP